MSTIASSRPLSTEKIPAEMRSKMSSGYDRYRRNTVGNVRKDCCSGVDAQCYKLLDRLAVSEKAEPMFGTPSIPHDLYERAKGLGISIQVDRTFVGKYQVRRVSSGEHSAEQSLVLHFVYEPGADWVAKDNGDGSLTVNTESVEFDGRVAAIEIMERVREVCGISSRKWDHRSA